MSTFVDRLRSLAEREQGTAKDLDLPLPGFGGEVLVRYGPLPWDRFLALAGDAAGGDADAVLQANLDALIGACEALMFRREDGEVVSLADELRAHGEDVQGELRFDRRALEVFGLQVGEPVTARNATLALFGGAVSPEVAVGQHADALAGWIAWASQEVDAALLGGRSAPRR